MKRYKHKRPSGTTPSFGSVHGCFDRELSIRRDLFEDAVAIFDIGTEGPPVVAAGRVEMLRLGDRDFELAWLIDWLAPFADGCGYLYYIHHHDNIVEEVALFEPYKRAAFRRRLRFFRTRPAAEGGSNLLGVVDAGQSWILILENDNQGRFRIDFFGPTEICRSLRLQMERQGNSG